MKIFKRKHFQALIYSIFLSLPLLSVLGRCVYTIVNKNAKDSYYGETINEAEATFITDKNDLLVGDTYYLHNVALLSSAAIGNNNQRIYFENLEVIENSSPHDITSAVSVGFYAGNTQAIYYYFFDNEGNTIGPLSQNYNFIIKFTYLTNNLTSTNILNTSDSVYYMTYNDYSYLDNAFEYSIDRFVSENDYGELDFFTWFSSLFLSGNSLDSLYIHFINWYMNYILYVSLGYLIFSVLLWFVNFFRRLVDDTENINVGGM